MKANYRKRFALLLLTGFLGMASAQAASWPDDDWESKKLEGSWVVQVTLRDCSLNTPLGPPFLSLLTFARGGTMTETTSSPMFFPAVRGPGHGVWDKGPRHTYKAVSTAFVTVNGALTRTQTIAQTIEMERDNTLKSTATVKFFGPDGTTLLTSACAVATGKRIDLED
jgi:hypothetical protein